MTNIFVRAWQGKSDLEPVFWLLFFIPAVLFVVGSIAIYLLAMIAMDSTEYATPISLVVPIPWVIYVAVVMGRCSNGFSKTKLTILFSLLMPVFVISYVFLVSQYQTGIQSIG